MNGQDLLKMVLECDCDANTFADNVVEQDGNLDKIRASLKTCKTREDLYNLVSNYI